MYKLCFPRESVSKTILLWTDTRNGGLKIKRDVLSSVGSGIE